MSIVPADILMIMEKEYSDMCLHIVQEICSLYSLDINDVRKKLGAKLSMTFDIDDTKNNYRYVKRAPPKKIDSTETNRCIANIYDFAMKTSRRCTRRRDSKTDPSCLFCGVHLRMYYSDTNRLSYGVAPEFQDKYDAFCKANKPPPVDIKPIAVKKQVLFKVK